MNEQVSERGALASFNALLSAGMSLQDAERISGVLGLAGDTRKHFNFFRKVAIESGAATGPAMTRLQHLVVTESEVAARVRQAMASPKATARLVHWLPAAALVLGQLAGLESVSVFFRSPLVLIALVAGACLLLVANIWSARILKAADIETENVFELDAIAICLKAGLNITQAKEIVQLAASSAYRREIEKPIDFEVSKAQGLADSAGIAIADLLLARADEIRREANYKKFESVEKLSVKLLWPLGIFVLPAFVLIAVLPMSIAIITKGAT